jgi:uncharacterized protein (DUF697 family)
MGRLRQAIGKGRALRPGRIREEAARRFSLNLIGADEADREALARVFVPDALAGAERARALACMNSASGGAVIAVRSPRVVGAAVAVEWRNPRPGLLALLRAHPEFRLALARVYPPLRDLLGRELIQAVAARNAAVAAISALPDVIPTPLSLVLALGEMGSDTILITANQVGLCFELAAMQGRRAGWSDQAGAIAGIVAAAFGWRRLARELVGLIPAGIGLAAKSGIAYSGTLAVGAALLRVSNESTTGLARLRQSA